MSQAVCPRFVLEFICHVGLVQLEANATNHDLQMVSHFTELRELSLGGSEITDEGIRELTSLTELDWLLLDAPQVTDGALEYLVGMKKMTRLILVRSSVTPAGVSRLQQALPQCEIEHYR
ncbi:MAG: hypothetical protein K8R36_25745 [Planctomycetales bacterium]|nr:hypothetical protein [Planctomycetales bacterium]